MKTASFEMAFIIRVFYEHRITAAKRKNKVALWAERISECRNSGLSVKTWCKEKGVCK